MTGWSAVIDGWRSSLDRMEDALERRAWEEAAAAVWSPPTAGPDGAPSPVQRLELADLDRRSARAARAITEAMAEVGGDLVESGRRRGAARAYLARRG